MKPVVRILTSMVSIACFAQTPTNPPNSAPKFEVASVRLTEPGARGVEGFQIQTSADSLTTRGMSLKDCIIWAYGMHAPQIIGPDWMDGVRLDIVGKASARSSQEQLYLMLRALLADRLGLKTHLERRQMPVYALMIAKGGTKFSESSADGPLHSSQDKGVLFLQHVSMFDLAAKLSGRVFDRPIVDETGLKGRYDIRLDLAAAMPANTDDRMDAASAMISALRVQMGLSLEGRREEINMLVIDHADKIPAEN